MNKNISIEAIKTDIGYYLKCKGDDSYTSNSSLNVYLFDGVPPKKTFNKLWVLVDKFPTKIEREVCSSPINHRYELIDPTMKSDKIPPVLQPKEIIFINEEGDAVWKPEFYHLSSLYKLVSDPQPNRLDNQAFEIKVVLEIDQIKDYAGFNYPVQRTRWEHEGFINLTNNDVIHDEIDTILFPDIVVNSRTSKLSSYNTYKIIRKYIQDNIDPKYAKISGDYDFCFAVEKKITLTTPQPYEKDVSSYRSKKPKYKTCYRNDRSIKIFEMTHSGEGGNYKGYTPIEPFVGKNLEDLKNNIDTFLQNLMEKINKPLIDCPHCDGMGVILEKQDKK